LTRFRSPRTKVTASTTEHIAEALRSAAFFRHLARLSIPPELRAAISATFTPESAAAARERLIAFVEWLEGTSNVKEIDAIRDYLSGRYESLDVAFGLAAPSAPRGAPADLDRKLEMAREIEGLKQQGKTWAQIADVFSARDPSDALDERSLRRVYSDFQDLRRRVWSSSIMTAEITGAALDLVGLPDESPAAVTKSQRQSKPLKTKRAAARRARGKAKPGGR
jgi:hypothetical protein